MNLNPIKANMTELKLNDYYILFSYRTPVVAWSRRTGDVYVTNKKWSRTTTRHMNVYLHSIQPHTPEQYKLVDQDFLDNLVK